MFGDVCARASPLLMARSGRRAAAVLTNAAATVFMALNHVAGSRNPWPRSRVTSRPRTQPHRCPAVSINMCAGHRGPRVRRGTVVGRISGNVGKRKHILL